MEGLGDNNMEDNRRCQFWAMEDRKEKAGGAGKHRGDWQAVGVAYAHSLC